MHVGIFTKYLNFFEKNKMKTEKSLLVLILSNYMTSQNADYVLKQFLYLSILDTA